MIILKYLLESSDTHLPKFWISILLFLGWLKYLRETDLIHDTRHHFARALGSWDKSNVTWYFKGQKHRKEKSLLHVAMVATENVTWKVNSHCFKLLRFYSFSFNLSNVGEISGVESERTVSKITKRKRKFLCCVHLLHKTGALSFHLGSFMSKSCNDG